MSEECKICTRPIHSEGVLCEYHSEAKGSLEEAYLAWKRAYSIGWREYLERIRDEENLGEWAREVVMYLIEENNS